MIKGELQMLNWNVAGAKYLELSADEREGFRKSLNQAIQHLLTNRPSVVTLQEIVRYHPEDNEAEAEHVIDVPAGYRYWPLWLIDTRHQSARGKWAKVRAKGGWTGNPFFAQGNGFLIREDMPCVRVFDLPAIGSVREVQDPIEIVKLESGLYLGTRDTEPRAAMIAHLVLSRVNVGLLEEPLRRPLDVFVVNLHLTTMTNEREGVPGVDQTGAKKRSAQLELVLNDIVSPYNMWQKNRYEIPGRPVPPEEGETRKRFKPVWVIAGDFNFTPESTEYQTIVRAGFIDLIPTHDLGTKTQGLGRRPTLTVDYVFAGPRFEAIDPNYAKEMITQNHVLYDNRTKVSDHFPLVVTVPISLPEDDDEA